MEKTAILMAGGKGSRLGNPEKCLIRIGGRRIIASLVETLSSLGFHNYVSTTGCHRNVVEFASVNGIGIIYTTGSGYEHDLRRSILSLSIVPVLLLPADFITSDKMLFQKVWELGIEKESGVVTFTINGNFNGISVFNQIPADGELDFETVNIESPVSFNINTTEDLELATNHFLSP